MAARIARGNAGFTIVEMLVATTLVALLAVYVGSAWASVLRENAQLASRTETWAELETARAFLTNDGSQATAARCVEGTLELVHGNEVGAPQVQYTLVDSRLYRLASSGQQILVATSMAGLSCVALEPAGVEVVLVPAHPRSLTRLRVSVVHLPEEPEGGEEETP